MRCIHFPGRNQANDLLCDLSMDNFITLTCWKISRTLLKPFYWLPSPLPSRCQRWTGWQIKPLTSPEKWRWCRRNDTTVLWATWITQKLAEEMRECENHRSGLPAGRRWCSLLNLKNYILFRWPPLCAVLISRPFFISIGALEKGKKLGQSADTERIISDEYIYKKNILCNVW